MKIDQYLYIMNSECGFSGNKNRRNRQQKIGAFNYRFKFISGLVLAKKSSK